MSNVLAHLWSSIYCSAVQELKGNSINISSNAIFLPFNKKPHYFSVYDAADFHQVLLLWVMSLGAKGDTLSSNQKYKYLMMLPYIRRQYFIMDALDLFLIRKELPLSKLVTFLSQGNSVKDLVRRAVLWGNDEWTWSNPWPLIWIVWYYEVLISHSNMTHTISFLWGTLNQTTA